jgi:hypothetical protein
MNTAVRTTSTPALLSLIFGLMSWLMLPVLGAIAAIICGHMGRSEIRKSPDRFEGDGLAIAGLILGYLQLVMAVLAVIVVIVVFGGLAAVLALVAANQ